MAVYNDCLQGMKNDRASIFGRIGRFVFFGFFVFVVFCVFAIDGQLLIFLCAIPAYCPVTALMKAEALSVPIWKVKDLPEAIFTYR